MKRQFLHEHHRRNEKAWVASAPSRGSESREGKPTRVYEREIRSVPMLDGSMFRVSRIRYNELIHKQQCKAVITEEFLAFLATQRFNIQGFSFKFSDTVSDFAKSNGLTIEQASKSFLQIAELAKGKLDIVKQRVSRSSVEFIRELSADGSTVEEWAKVEAVWDDVLPLHPV